MTSSSSSSSSFITTTFLLRVSLLCIICLSMLLLYLLSSHPLLNMSPRESMRGGGSNANEMYYSREQIMRRHVSSTLSAIAAAESQQQQVDEIGVEISTPANGDTIPRSDLIPDIDTSSQPASRALSPPLHPSLITLLQEGRTIPQPIPKLVHFIFGLKDNPAEVKFSFIHYCAIKSAHDMIKPARIYVHGLNFPSLSPETTQQGGVNEWWAKVQPWITLRRVRNVTHVFGNPVTHFAHKADVLRLEILLQYGGIYLDIDVITVKSFDDLLQHNTVLGEEMRSTATTSHGYGNGVILAHRNSPFLRAWYDGYRMFSNAKGQWSQMSIQFPKKLDETMPKSGLFVLPSTAFYTPCWDKKASELFYDRNDFDLTPNYAVHVWSSDKSRVNGPEDVCRRENLFGRLLRKAWMEGLTEEEVKKRCTGGVLGNEPTPWNGTTSVVKT